MYNNLSIPLLFYMLGYNRNQDNVYLIYLMHRFNDDYIYGRGYCTDSRFNIAVDIVPTVGSISPWILHRQSVQYRCGYCTDSRFNIAMDIARTVGSLTHDYYTDSRFETHCRQLIQYGHRALLIFPLVAMLTFCQIIRKLDLRKNLNFNTITAVMSLIC